MNVRRLREPDVPAFLDLIDGLADYEKLPRPTDDARARMARDAIRDEPPFRALVAEAIVDGTPRLIGYAVYFFTYSTFLAQPTLYLEDIFVHPDHRGRGAGRALFSACTREAIASSCGRMDWHVLDWNEPAIAFYERSGARLQNEWRLCRLTGDALLQAGQ